MASTVTQPDLAAAGAAAASGLAAEAAAHIGSLGDRPVLVKWESPAAEVQGIAAGAAALLRDKLVTPRRLGFAVPNRTWAASLARACEAMGMRAAIAEGAPAADRTRAAIFDFRTGTAATGFDWLFVVGCTEGLMPTAAATGTDAASAATLAEQQAAFDSLTAEARPHVVLSYFGEAEAALADQIRLPYRRTVLRDGAAFARLAPSPFIGAMGARRPTTVGGQRFLRDAGLN